MLLEIDLIAKRNLINLKILFSVLIKYLRLIHLSLLYFPLGSPRSIDLASLLPIMAPAMAPNGPATAKPIRHGAHAASAPVAVPYSFAIALRWLMLLVMVCFLFVVLVF